MKFKVGDIIPIPGGDVQIVYISVNADVDMPYLAVQRRYYDQGFVMEESVWLNESGQTCDSAGDIKQVIEFNQ